MVIGVMRAPAFGFAFLYIINGYPLVTQPVAGLVAFVDSRNVNEGLEGRTRLPFGLLYMVEFEILEVDAAYPRFNMAGLRIEGNQASPQETLVISQRIEWCHGQ